MNVVTKQRTISLFPPLPPTRCVPASIHLQYLNCFIFTLPNMSPQVLGQSVAVNWLSRIPVQIAPNQCTFFVSTISFLSGARNTTKKCPPKSSRPIPPSNYPVQIEKHLGMPLTFSCPVVHVPNSSAIPVHVSVFTTLNSYNCRGKHSLGATWHQYLQPGTSIRAHTRKKHFKRSNPPLPPPQLNKSICWNFRL